MSTIARKDLDLFQQEKPSTYASAAISTASGSSEDPQAWYDITFDQCMYSHGNRILGAWIGAGYPAYAGIIIFLMVAKAFILGTRAAPSFRALSSSVGYCGRAA